jgi:AraC-like DNA-binding protein
MITDIRKRVTIPDGCRERFLPLDDPDLAALVDRGVINAGISRLEKGYYNGRPRSDDVMLIWTTGGCGRLETVDGGHDLPAGSLLVCGPGLSYQFWPTITPWRLAWCYCRRGLDGGRAMPRGVWLGPEPDATRVEGLLSELIEDCHRPPGAHAADRYRRRLAEALLVWLERAGLRCGTGGEDPEQARVGRLLAALRADPGRAWTIEAMAALAEASPSTLQRLLRRQLGESPHRLLVHLRMELAARLLRQSEYPLALVAQRVGYADAFVFSTAFRKYHGLAPSRWRAAPP